jgi:superfamily II DNA/RNA helicase
MELEILVFTRTKQEQINLQEAMIGAGIKAAAIHGNKDKVRDTKLWLV